MKAVKRGCFKIEDYSNKKNYPIERKIITMQEGKCRRGASDEQRGRCSGHFQGPEHGRSPAVRGEKTVRMQVHVGW